MTRSDAEIRVPPHPLKRAAILLGKLLLTALALFIVFTRIDVAQMWAHVRGMPPYTLLLAWVVLFLAQVTSAFRMRYYFKQGGYGLQLPYCIATYFAGATMNLVLPGGISGDGYKALVLRKHKDIPVLGALRLILSERANGLFFLLLYALLFLAISGITAKVIPYSHGVLAVLSVLLFGCYVAAARILLKERLRTLIGAFRFSALSQTLVVLSAYTLFHAMGLDAHMMEYLAVFMISNVVAILPISIGGAGLRELTFYYSSVLFGLSAEQSVAASLTFFAVHCTVSLTGIFFIHQLGRIAAK
jgi:uncharacterized membrane protein YbhN (UPF0104 family)